IDAGFRSGIAPTAIAPTLGFRVVCDPPQKTNTESQYSLLFEADVKAYEKWLDGLKAAELRPDFVSVRSSSSGPRFSAIAVRNPHRLAWEERHGLDAE